MNNKDIIEKIKKLLREIPDFPRKGILFKDITPVLAEPGALAWICDELIRPYKEKKITKILAIESRGFFFGTGMADRLGVGLVPVRKSGKLPYETLRESYSLEYGEASLEIHKDAVNPNDHVVIIDDVLATGGTAKATSKLVERLGGKIVGFSCFLEIAFLNGRSALNPTHVHSMIRE